MKKMIHEKIQLRRVIGTGNSKCKGPEVGIFGRFKEKQYQSYNMSSVTEGKTSGTYDSRGGQGQVI